MHRQRGGNSSGGMGRQAALLLVAAVALMLRGVGAKTQAMSGKMMNNPSMTGSHASDASFFDYIVVGSGPGGATVARYLSDDPKIKVLLLEAGENHDNDKVIRDSADAWIVPVEYVPEYFWQIMMMHNEIPYSTHEFPEEPIRRLEAYEKDVEEGQKRADVEDEVFAARFGRPEAGQPRDQRRKLVEKVHRQLHGYSTEMEMEQYMGGRLMGGSSSINGKQVVWPTRRLLENIQAAVGGDPDWSPDAVYNTLREMETYMGTSPQTRGSTGPLDVKQAPTNPMASGPGVDFVDATVQYFGPTGAGNDPRVQLVEDYNDPNTPLSIFYQWQLSQQPNGNRESSSTAMLPQEVKERKNLVIKTRATAMYIKFKKSVAQGVYYTHAGLGQVAYARKEVIVAAGHRSSFLLENSGVGNKMILEPILSRVGFPMVADVPGVGEHLGNDGVVIVTLNRSTTATFNPNLDDLYAGGAFTPYPNASANPDNPYQTTLRFGQLIGVDKFPTSKDFSIAAIVLNTTSLGWAHIQSADPLYQPLVTARTLNTPVDRGNWWYIMREQVAGIVTTMQANSPSGAYQIKSPADPNLILQPLNEVANKNTFKKAFNEWISASYIPSHHWFGTCRMGTDPSKGAVTDSSGRVYGTRKLRVADASIYPIKLDGNTQVPAYIAGAIVAKKILREYYQGVHRHQEL